MALDFPASSASPYTAPNGVVYTWNADGYWEAKADPNDFDTDYLKLNATNGPVTGALTFEQLTTHEKDIISVGGIRQGTLTAGPSTDGGVYVNKYVRVYGNLTDFPEGNINDSQPFQILGADTATDNKTVRLSLNASGSAYFAGLTTHEDGVSVTGGTAASVGSGLYSTNTNNIRLAGNGVELAVLSESQVNFTPNEITDTIVRSKGTFVGTITDFDKGNSFISLPTLDAGCTIADFKHFHAFTNAGSGTATNSYGFLASANLADNGTNASYGFYSNLPTSTGKNFNFYAQGNGPNYFGGIIRTGNVANPGGIDSNGNPEANDGPMVWATESNSSNATRIANQYIHISRYNTNAELAPCGINRLGASTGVLIGFAENGNFIDRIKLDGSGGITYGVSDYRLKENIVDLPSATDAIKGLRPVNFNFKSHPGKTRPGFIAHELQDTLPVAVVGTKDATEEIGTLADYDGTVLETEVTEPDDLTYTAEVETDGVTTATVRTRIWTPTGSRPVYQGVDQTKLIPLLTKALQEALERIEALEAGGATSTTRKRKS